jgi:chromosomal replication initiator protein
VWVAFSLKGKDSWATKVAACSSSAFESGKAAGADAGGLHAAKTGAGYWQGFAMTDSSRTETVRSSDSVSTTASPGRTRRAPTQATQDNATERRLLASLSREVGAERYARYFDRSADVRVHKGRVDVAAPTAFAARYLERRFADSIRKVASRELGIETPQTVQLNFRVRESSRSGETQDTSTNGASTRSPARADPNPTRTKPARPPVRPAQWRRLEEFVVGDANRLAYAASTRIADDDAGSLVSPLFIHGMCGIGKTHLLQGIADRYRKRHPGASVRYTTAEAFTNSYVQSIRANNLDVFRKRFRRVDLLCIDDVHFLARKKSTQSELLHTFDAIDLDGSRVVLASDGHPAQIDQLNDALRSRFLAGMIVRLDPPEPQLRLKLVRALAQRRSLLLDEQSISAIARHGSSDDAAGSVREIEGLLTRVDACHRMLSEGSGPVGASAIRLALGSGSPAGLSRPVRPVRIADIVAEVCRTLCVERDDVFGKGRHRRVVLARALCAHLARQLTTLSYPEIARGIGRPNHSSVITAKGRLARQMTAGERATVDNEEVELTVLAGRIARQINLASSRRG